jgi:hypothetical protein
MILFQAISQIATAAVDDLPAERPADGTRVGVVPVRGHAVGGVADHRPDLAEEAPGRLPVTRLAEQ